MCSGREASSLFSEQAMTRSIHAVYESGVLRPLEPLNLPEKKLVTVTIVDETQAESEAPFLPDPAPLSDDDFEHLLDELALGPALPHLPADFSRADVYSDHD
jgi:predicted DNA-binding antitoxin AbrB/MazE fold protein